MKTTSKRKHVRKPKAATPTPAKPKSVFAIVDQQQALADKLAAEASKLLTLAAGTEPAAVVEATVGERNILAIQDATTRTMQLTLRKLRQLAGLMGTN